MGLLDQLFGAGLAGLVEAARQYLPECHVCGESAVFRCRECGKFVCHRHSFVSPEPLQVACRPCMGEHFDWAARAGGSGPPSAMDEWPYAEMPWDVLGTHAEASEAEVRTAYRQLSMQCHPDRGGSPEAQAKLNAAYSIMLEKARRRAP